MKMFPCISQYARSRAVNSRSILLRIVMGASLDNDPEKIGKHMLEMLVKFRNEGLFDIVVEEE